MTSKIEALEQIAGVPANQPELFLQALEEKSLPVPHRKWPAQVRRGETNGGIFYNTVQLALAQGQSSSKKDLFYRKTAQETLALRTAGTGVRRACFGSNGLTEKVGKDLGVTPYVIREVLISMRADLVFGNPTGKDNLFLQYFTAVAGEFLRAHTELIQPSRRNSRLVELNESWDGSSVASFYRKLYEYSTKSGHTVASWVPYEAEVMQHYYEGRINRGSQPTLLDQKILGARTQENLKNLAAEIVAETALPVTFLTLNRHRDTLVYGIPRITVPEPQTP